MEGTDVKMAVPWSQELAKQHNGSESPNFDDEDMGPETDVDSVDDVLVSPLDKAKALVHQANTIKTWLPKKKLGESEQDWLKTLPWSMSYADALKQPAPKKVEEKTEISASKPEQPIVKPLEKTAAETTEQQAEDKKELNKTAQDANDDVAEVDSEEDSDEEWNYTPGEEKQKNHQPTAEQDPDDDMSQLNPNAAEFVPVFGSVTDEVVASSPAKGSEKSLENITVPNDKEFYSEISKRPSELETLSDERANHPIDDSLNCVDITTSSTKAQCGDDSFSSSFSMAAAVEAVEAETAKALNDTNPFANDQIQEDIVQDHFGMSNLGFKPFDPMQESIIEVKGSETQCLDFDFLNHSEKPDLLSPIESNPTNMNHEQQTSSSGFDSESGNDEPDLTSTDKCDLIAEITSGDNVNMESAVKSKEEVSETNPFSSDMNADEGAPPSEGTNSPVAPSPLPCEISNDMESSDAPVENMKQSDDLLNDSSPFISVKLPNSDNDSMFDNLASNDYLKETDDTPIMSFSKSPEPSAPLPDFIEETLLQSKTPPEPSEPAKDQMEISKSPDPVSILSGHVEPVGKSPEPTELSSLAPNKSQNDNFSTSSQLPQTPEPVDQFPNSPTPQDSNISPIPDSQLQNSSDNQSKELNCETKSEDQVTTQVVDLVQDLHFNETVPSKVEDNQQESDGFEFINPTEEDLQDMKQMNGWSTSPKLESSDNIEEDCKTNVSINKTDILDINTEPKNFIPDIESAMLETSPLEATSPFEQIPPQNYVSDDKKNQSYQDEILEVKSEKTDVSASPAVELDLSSSVEDIKSSPLAEVISPAVDEPARLLEDAQNKSEEVKNQLTDSIVSPIEEITPQELVAEIGSLAKETSSESHEIEKPCSKVEESLSEIERSNDKQMENNLLTPETQEESKVTESIESSPHTELKPTDEVPQVENNIEPITGLKVDVINNAQLDTESASAVTPPSTPALGPTEEHKAGLMAAAVAAAGVVFAGTVTLDKTEEVPKKTTSTTSVTKKPESTKPTAPKTLSTATKSSTVTKKPTTPTTAKAPTKPAATTTPKTTTTAKPSTPISKSATPSKASPAKPSSPASKVSSTSSTLKSTTSKPTTPTGKAPLLSKTAAPAPKSKPVTSTTASSKPSATKVGETTVKKTEVSKTTTAKPAPAKPAAAKPAGTAAAKPAGITAKPIAAPKAAAPAKPAAARPTPVASKTAPSSVGTKTAAKPATTATKPAPPKTVGSTAKPAAAPAKPAATKTTTTLTKTAAPATKAPLTKPKTAAPTALKKPLSADKSTKESTNQKLTASKVAPIKKPLTDNKAKPVTKREVIKDTKEKEPVTQEPTVTTTTVTNGHNGLIENGIKNHEETSPIEITSLPIIDALN